MKKAMLSKKTKAEHKSDEAILMGAQEVEIAKEDYKYEWVKRRLAQDALIYERIKCPVMAMVCCLMPQV